MDWRQMSYMMMAAHKSDWGLQVKKAIWVYLVSHADLISDIGGKHCPISRYAYVHLFQQFHENTAC